MELLTKVSLKGKNIYNRTNLKGNAKYQKLNLHKFEQLFQVVNQKRVGEFGQQLTSFCMDKTYTTSLRFRFCSFLFEMVIKQDKGAFDLTSQLLMIVIKCSKY